MLTVIVAVFALFALSVAIYMWAAQQSTIVQLAVSQERAATIAASVVPPRTNSWRSSTGRRPDRPRSTPVPRIENGWPNPPPLIWPTDQTQNMKSPTPESHFQKTIDFTA